MMTDRAAPRARPYRWRKIVKRRSILVLAASLAAAAALFAAPRDAAAHAFVSHASPAVGSTVHGSPPELELWFTEDIEPGFCKVEVVDQSGKRVDQGGLKLAPDSKAALILPLPSLAPGVYKVIWHAVSVDTHKTGGSFAFTVAP
jgi:methionine-rich copper-binding protein CopC